MFEINLLQTWFVYSESAVSPISAAFFFCFCWTVKMLSIQRMTGFENLRPDENWQCIVFDPFCTVSYGIFFMLYYRDTGV